jgi:hypothetical protein
MRLPKPLPRKLHFMSSGMWSYQIGKTGVKIRNPDCTKSHFIPYADLLCMTQEEINRNGIGDVTPALIKEHIATHFFDPNK